MTDAVAIDGLLTIHAAAEQQQRLCRALDDAPGDLTLDLRGVENCDSAGVQLLLAARAQLGGRRLRLADPSPPVRAALHSYGLLPLFGLAP